MRELAFSNSLRSRDYELQYQTLQCSRAQLQAREETTHAATLRQQVDSFTHTETELRSQLNIYVEKFKQVEETLNNSNDLFLTFRKEMEEMSKKTKRLEKENVALTRIKETGNRNILEMAEDKQKRDLELETLRKKCLKLENLCRALQQERKGLGSGANNTAHGTHDPLINGVVAQAEAELRAAEEAAAKAVEELDDEETESDYGYEDGEAEEEDDEFEIDEEGDESLVGNGPHGQRPLQEGMVPLKALQTAPTSAQNNKTTVKMNGVASPIKNHKSTATNGAHA